MASWTVSPRSSAPRWKQGLEVAGGAALHPFALPYIALHPTAPLCTPLHCCTIAHAGPGLVPPLLREQRSRPGQVTSLLPGTEEAERRLGRRAGGLERNACPFEGSTVQAELDLGRNAFCTPT